jgi:hypothetical protein
MYLRFIALAVLSLYISDLSAQDALVHESRVQVPQHGSEQWDYRIENAGTSPVIAFRVELQCSGNHTYERTIDSLVAYGSPQHRPIAPGSTYSFVIPDWASTCPAKSDTGVILANGTTAGSSANLDWILAQRKGTYDALQYVKPKLEAVATGKLDAATVAASFRSDMQQSNHDSTLGAAAWSGRVFVLSVAASLLENQQDFLVPSDLQPNRPPGIEETMAHGNLSHERAHATVVSRKLAEWIRDLRNDPSFAKFNP